jgi:threonyl-tRNA synthetase
MVLRVRLSFRDPKDMNKYLGTKEIWDRAENELRTIAEKRGGDFFEGPGEAALYGPKLDFMAKNSAGREWQVATIQLDMNMPERFDLTCVNEKGEKERIVMIHSAISGSLERGVAFLIEYYKGAFPLWLAPVQVKVIPVRTGHNSAARKVFEMLRANNIRAELDEKDENLGSKVRDAKSNKVPYWIVIGDKEVEAGKVTLESRDAGGLGQMGEAELLNKLLEEIKNKK